MKNPISDNDWSMFPERPEVLEYAKNATSHGLMQFVERNIENFGRRVRVGTWFNSSTKHIDTLTDRGQGHRYIIEIGGDAEDFGLDPEYTLEPFERSIIGFRIVRNR